MWIVGVVENIAQVNGGIGLLLILQEQALKTRMRPPKMQYLAVLHQVLDEHVFKLLDSIFT